MAFSPSRRVLLGIFIAIFIAYVAADALDPAREAIAQIQEQTNQIREGTANTANSIKEGTANTANTIKESTSSAFDTIKDKIALGSEDIQNLLRLSALKQADAQKSRSWVKWLFSILFPSSKPWLNALLATAYISGPPNFILALCPPNINPSSLSVMVAFAVGGLLGDTFFHLLPEIFLGEDDESSKIRLVMLEPNRNLLLGVFIFVGLATFMAMDKGLRIATGAGHSHSHSSGEHGKPANLSEQASKIDERDYRLTNNLQELARSETKEEQQTRLSEKPYNDTFVGDSEHKTRDFIKKLAETNQTIRKRATFDSNVGDTPATRSAATNNQGPNQRSGTDPRPLQGPEHPELPPVDPNPRSYHSQITATDDESSTNNLEPTAANSLTQSKPDHQKRSELFPKSPDVNPSVKLAGLLNLLADFTHNITDGLALATSFYTSPTLGATTTMAVFFHEIPHEVGDFALLIQSGFSKRSAMMAQFVTAIGAFIGTIIGILVQEYGSGETGITGQTKEGLLGTSLQWADMLLPFTAGTFLYVGTVGVIPELLENEKGASRFQEVGRTLGQFGAMAIGALIMVAISWN